MCDVNLNKSRTDPRKVILPKEKVERLYAEGMTMEEIGKVFNTTKRVVHLRMQEFGIKRRKMVGKDHGSWKGGRVKKMGYWAIWNPTHPRADHMGYVKEHVLIMEKLLNRNIDKTEHIHHIDGDRANNETKNLWLCNNKTHHIAEQSVNKLIIPLLEKNIIKFNRELGKYELV